MEGDALYYLFAALSGRLFVCCCFLWGLGGGGGGVIAMMYLQITSANWLWRGWCHTKLLPSRCRSCAHHAMLRQFTVLFEATYMHLAIQFMLGYFSVSIIHRTLTWTSRSFWSWTPAFVVFWLLHGGPWSVVSEGHDWDGMIRCNLKQDFFKIFLFFSLFASGC